jgi:hypothetical protein
MCSKEALDVRIFSLLFTASNNSRHIQHVCVYTVTKVNGLFRAPARMSVIKLFLARNMIYFCGLNKTLCQPGALEGFFKTRLVYLFPCMEFSKKFYFPSPEYSKTIRCTCSQTGVFRGCSLSQPGITPDFRALLSKKILPAAGFDPPTFWILSKCLTSTHQI